ncbi:MAG: gliding motility-associated C-terminal domain-containing protein, partial [Flavobacteriaceae bacterium]|nr:gliding motility-associated C-terminal domain-containing protein [Flavobacteriaceae bacterium]
ENGTNRVCIEEENIILRNPTADEGKWTIEKIKDGAKEIGKIEPQGKGKALYYPAKGVDGVGEVKIVYTVKGKGTTCDDAVATFILRVVGQPRVEKIEIDNPSICSTGTAQATVVDGDDYGEWTSSNPKVATVDPVSGVITGVSKGKTIITYTVKASGNKCGKDARKSLEVRVVSSPNAGKIVGEGTVCTDDKLIFTNPTSDEGEWSASSGTITQDGVYTPARKGIVKITYTVRGGAQCGDVSTFKMIRVVSEPRVEEISIDEAVICSTSITQARVIDGDRYGEWTSSNPKVVTVDPVNGVVTAVGKGIAAITYTVKALGSCGKDARKSINIEVVKAPSAGKIIGNEGVCSDDTIAFANPTADEKGIWEISPANAGSIEPYDTDMIFKPKKDFRGDVVVSYTIKGSGPCNKPDVVRKIIKVIKSPNAGEIKFENDKNIMCSGEILRASTTGDKVGGTWISGDEKIAKIDPVSGMITAVSTGRVTISYRVSISKSDRLTCVDCTPCLADSYATKEIEVVSAPVKGEIIGGDEVCTASTIQFANPTADEGEWSVATADGTIDKNGIYTPSEDAKGDVIIKYTVKAKSPCSSDVVAIKVVKVVPAPNAGTITTDTGVNEFCFTKTIQLSTDGVPEGTWVSTDETIATVNASGFVRGVSMGTVEIKYIIDGKGSCADKAVSKITLNVTDCDTDGDGVTDSVEKKDGTDMEDPCDYEVKHQDKTKITEVCTCRQMADSYLFIPKGFSPNGDGKNDLFVIKQLDECFPDFRIRVYNRWGDLVFDSEKGSRTDGSKWWDGYYNLRVNAKDKVPVGTYFYVVEFDKNNDGRGKNNVRQGWVYVNY